MSKIITILTLIILFTLETPDSTAQSFDTLCARVQRVIDSMRTVPPGYYGISAGVTIPTHGTCLKVSGISHGNVNIIPGMKFGIASQTKTFIAVLMLKLQEMNVLSLDDSLDEWLPNFQYVDSTITIRQLLNHTSGVFNFIDHSNFQNAVNADTGRRWTPEEILTTFMEPPYFLPGQGWHYSNTNYILAGLVIRAATDTSVSYKLRQLILNPFGFNSTYFAVEETIPDTIAHAWINGNYRGGFPRTSFYSSIWAAGAMYSTSDNMLRFYDSLFSGRIVNQSSLSQMLTFVPCQGLPCQGYGLGIGRYAVNGRTFWAHGGDWWGYDSGTGYDSAWGFIITELINTRPSNSEAVFFTIYQTVIDNYPEPFGIIKIGEIIPQLFQLFQNYPNPFNPKTKITFGIAKLGNVKLMIYDALGREAAMLVNEQLKSGTFEVEWDASNYPSGVYFYKLTAGDPSTSSGQIFTETKKMVLLK